MTIVIQPVVPVIIGITLFLVIGLKLVNKKLLAFDPLDTPRGIVMISMTVIELIEGMINDIMSKDYVEKLGPYLTSLGLYIILAEYCTLLGFEGPCANWSVTLSLALITFIMIQKTDIKYNGIKNYIHSFFEPVFLFLVANFFGTIAPLLSMSLRLFGNNISGSIIMGLVYNLGNTISNAFYSLFGLKDVFNFVGPILAAPLHCYFDIFSGFIQMYIFVMLTMVFVGNKIPDDQK